MAPFSFFVCGYDYTTDADLKQTLSFVANDTGTSLVLPAHSPNDDCDLTRALLTRHSLQQRHISHTHSNVAIKIHRFFIRLLACTSSRFGHLYASFFLLRKQSFALANW